MNVLQTAFLAFNRTLAQQHVAVTQAELANILERFNHLNVQKFIDADIERTRLEAQPINRQTAATERERYHTENISNIATVIARQVIAEKLRAPQREISKALTENYKGMVKTAAARGCDGYPC
jgi:superfamily I DNA and RNA helicase